MACSSAVHFSADSYLHLAPPQNSRQDRLPLAARRIRSVSLEYVASTGTTSEEWSSLEMSDGETSTEVDDIAPACYAELEQVAFCCWHQKDNTIAIVIP